MFKQLSQIGKNITDEISRGLNEDFSTQDSNQVQGQQQQAPAIKREATPSEYDDYPKEIQAKLRKFEKYEQKYPLLLTAYKAEKEKAEDIEALIKILSENTPVSSLNEADQLKGFFEDLNMKNSLLNDEVKRLSYEAISRDKELEELKQLAVEQYSKVSANEDKDLDALLETQKLKLEQKYDEIVREKDGEIEELKSTLQKVDQKIETLELLVAEKENALSGLDGQLKDQDEKLNQMEKLLSLYKDVIKEFDEPKSNVVSKGSPPTSTGRSNKRNKNKKNKNKQSVKDIAGGGVNLEHDGVDNKDKEPGTSLSEAIFSSIETKVKYENLCGDYEKLKEELEKNKKDGDQYREMELRISSLQSELSDTKVALKTRNEELEMVKDMLKTVGNELVDAKDKLKEQGGTSDEELKRLKAEVEALHDAKSQSASSYEEQLGKLTKEVATLLDDKNRLESVLVQSNDQLTRAQEQVQKFRIQNNEMNDKMREFNTLKKSESNSKLALAQREKTIAYLEQQVKDYSLQGSNAQKALRDLEIERERLNKRIEYLVKDLERTKSESKKSSGSLENYIKENGKLSERLEVLQEKYDTVKSLKSNSNNQVDSIKRQCEELNVKLKEANKKIIALEEELNENANILQERTRETNAMRRLLNDDHTDTNAKFRELEEKLAIIRDERDKLKSELDIQVSRRHREVQDLRETNLELKSQISTLTLKEKEYETEVLHLKAVNQRMQRRSSTASEGSEELELVVKSLKESLGNSEQRLRNLKASNQELRLLNSDLNSKLERLSKNYKLLSGQLKVAKEQSGGGATITAMGHGTQSARSSRSGSISIPPSPGNGGEQQQVDASSMGGMKRYATNSGASGATHEVEVNEKIAYIKNVLLGFLEHREQRSQLLPVVTTLLHLDKSDERRLLTSLK
ncbi:Imh1p Ecym_8374 [Eremothecium cymbalariae DBVPG|uniref:GRIP domain-containing protein n=1 Tax=Eremothecium cymbalariae (strain CBS 270.75 / DBVPG 7215 / KCTC 17166 / NRRL Y-17582) TaxID=931890 RepID=G8JXS1_ERECY|nr:Hypothetical protein Ecym_8374 [Eremothecium cymbalariae DBVPG\